MYNKVKPSCGPVNVISFAETVFSLQEKGVYCKQLHINTLVSLIANFSDTCLSGSFY